MKLKGKISLKKIYRYLFPGKSFEDEINDFSEKYPQTDIKKVLESLNSFIVAIERGDKTKINELVYMHDVELIKKYAQNNAYYSFDILPLKHHVTVLQDGRVKIQGKMIFQSGDEDFIKKNFQGISHYFIFALRKGAWVIVDTNFHTTLNFKYLFLQFFKFVAFIAVILGIGFLGTYYFNQFHRIKYDIKNIRRKYN